MGEPVEIGLTAFAEIQRLPYATCMLPNEREKNEFEPCAFLRLILYRDNTLGKTSARIDHELRFIRPPYRGAPQLSGGLR